MFWTDSEEISFLKFMFFVRYVFFERALFFSWFCWICNQLAQHGVLWFELSRGVVVVKYFHVRKGPKRTIFATHYVDSKATRTSLLLSLFSWLLMLLAENYFQKNVSSFSEVLKGHVSYHRNYLFHCANCKGCVSEYLRWLDTISGYTLRIIKS